MKVFIYLNDFFIYFIYYASPNDCGFDAPSLDYTISLIYVKLLLVVILKLDNY